LKAAVLALNAGAVREDLKAEEPRRIVDAIVVWGYAMERSKRKKWRRSSRSSVVGDQVGDQSRWTRSFFSLISPWLAEEKAHPFTLAKTTIKNAPMKGLTEMRIRGRESIRMVNSHG
jgi:hypothetical protein